MRSSYIQNNYGEVFFTLVEAFRPMNVVELGVLDGYSTLAIARGLKHIDEWKRVNNPHLNAYDLWDGYPYKHGDLYKVNDMLKEQGVGEYVTLQEGDAFEVWRNHEDRTVHFLHVDISNTGDILRRIMEVWDPKIRNGGLVVVEGGTEERDQVEWMVKYEMEPIRPEIFKNKRINLNYVYGTYRKFPGLTVMLKKFDHEIGIEEGSHKKVEERHKNGK
jgi:hypothetical protein